MTENLKNTYKGEKPKIDDVKSPEVVATDLLVAIADVETLRLPFLEGGHLPEIVKLLELPTGNIRVVRNLLKVSARLSVNGTVLSFALSSFLTLLFLLRHNHEAHDTTYDEHP